MVLVIINMAAAVAVQPSVVAADSGAVAAVVRPWAVAATGVVIVGVLIGIGVQMNPSEAQLKNFPGGGTAIEGREMLTDAGISPGVMKPFVTLVVDGAVPEYGAAVSHPLDHEILGIASAAIRAREPDAILMPAIAPFATDAKITVPAGPTPASTPPPCATSSISRCFASRISTLPVAS